MNMSYSSFLTEYKRKLGALKKESMQYLEMSVRQIVDNELSMAYSAYLLRRPKNNFITWGEMKAAVKIETSYSPLGLMVSLNEDAFLKNSNFRRNIYEGALSQLYGNENLHGPSMVDYINMSFEEEREHTEKLWDRISFRIQSFIKNDFSVFLQKNQSSGRKK